MSDVTTERRPWVVDSLAALRLRTTGKITVAACSAIGLIAYLWPFFTTPETLTDDAFAAHSTDATLLMFVILPLMLFVLGAEISDHTIDSRAIALLGVLCAVGAVLRIPGGGVSGFSPMFFLIVLAGAVFGSGFGFILGALTMFVSAIITAGIGPWLPFQMFGLAWVGAGAGVVGRLFGRSLRAQIIALAVYGCVVGFAFGALLNLWFWPFAAPTGSAAAYDPAASAPENIASYARFYVATSLGWDLLRAIGNVIMTVVAGPPILHSLKRAASRANFATT